MVETVPSDTSVLLQIEKVSYKEREELTVEYYTREEIETVKRHIETYFGEIEKVWQTPVSSGVNLKIALLPPQGKRDYYILVTMGVGAHGDDEPIHDRSERTELMIALASDWKVDEESLTDENWYWPVRLLQSLAEISQRDNSPLKPGYMVDYRTPFAPGTALCAALLTPPQEIEDGGTVCILPSGKKINFYQVFPLYQSEMEYAKSQSVGELLALIKMFPLAVRQDRANAVEWAELDDMEYMDLVMDDGDWHLDSIHEKKLPVDEIAAFNHMAIYLRWCIEHDLMCEAFMQKGKDAVNAVKNPSCQVDLRSFIRDDLNGLLIYTLFNEQGEEFARYYYDDEGVPCFPCDIDDYTLQYFGPQRYYSDAFKQEAYLFLPFDENYYQAMASVIQHRWDCWQGQEISGETEPSELAQVMMRYLHCECQYFPPMRDDDPITAALGYAQRLGVREGFVPVLVVVDDILWECLSVNSDSEQEDTEGYGFDAEQVEKYRKAMLSLPVEEGKKILERLIDQRREEHMDWADWSVLTEDDDEDTEWLNEILGEIKETAPQNGFLSYWDFETNMTLPLILAKIPVKNPWEVFAYLPFGGWNECPDTAQLMAVAKYWYQEHGAIPAVMTHDVLEFLLPAPVSEKKAEELAREQYGLCPDVVGREEGEDVIQNLADTLQQSDKWYFWWD